MSRSYWSQSWRLTCWNLFLVNLYIQWPIFCNIVSNEEIDLSTDSFTDQGNQINCNPWIYLSIIEISLWKRIISDNVWSILNWQNDADWTQKMVVEFSFESNLFLLNLWPRVNKTNGQMINQVRNFFTLDFLK